MIDFIEYEGIRDCIVDGIIIAKKSINNLIMFNYDDISILKVKVNNKLLKVDNIETIKNINIYVYHIYLNIEIAYLILDSSNFESYNEEFFQSFLVKQSCNMHSEVEFNGHITIEDIIIEKIYGNKYSLSIDIALRTGE